jgi:hypothetical protein
MLLLLLAALPFALRADIVTTVFTDKSDYLPGETVLIRGFDWHPREEVVLVLHDRSGGLPDVTLFARADAKGEIYNDEFVTQEYHRNVVFTLTATGTRSGRQAQATAQGAGNPSATLDQCANDPFPSPNSDGCSVNASDWVNGNLGASKANYFEGDSIPYRLTLDNLSLGSRTITIEWDTTKGGKGEPRNKLDKSRSDG